MASTIPVRQTVPTAAIKQAVSSDGSTSVNTVTVENKIVGKNRLKFTLTNTTGADIVNAVFLPGAWNTTRTLPAGITFSAQNFLSYASIQQMFLSNSTQVSGLRMSTNDVTNFEGEWQVTKKDVTGKETTVEIDLSVFRVPLGNGYGESIELSASDFSFLLSSATEHMLSVIKANSKIDFYLNVNGQNTSKTLSPLKANEI